jgi:raffinose/stachyose/melibiose transport system substrate-binding protein
MRMDGAWKRGGIALAALIAGLAAANAGSLKIESWRNDDADIWNSKIIPAFNKHYPDIKVEFAPSAPKEYNAALNARLAGGTAGDIIAEIGLDDGRRQDYVLRADGFGHPRLHL